MHIMHAFRSETQWVRWRRAKGVRVCVAEDDLTNSSVALLNEGIYTESYIPDSLCYIYIYAVQSVQQLHDKVKPQVTAWFCLLHVHLHVLTYIIMYFTYINI